MPPAGFKLATQASDLPQTLALDRSATGIEGAELSKAPIVSAFWKTGKVLFKGAERQCEGENWAKSGNGAGQCWVNMRNK